MSEGQLRARFLFQEVNERGFDLPLASVTRDGGVEFRADLDISVWNPDGDTSNYKRVRPGDFVIGLRSFQSGIGFSDLEGLVSPAYTVLRATSPRVHHGFFKHLFKSDAFISRLANVAQGIRQGRTIATEDFFNIRIAVPPLSSQRAIADYLDTETARIDALIERKKRMVELLEERRQETTLAAVSGKLTTAGPYSPVDIPWLTEVPSGWSSPLLRLVAVQGTGHTPSRSKPEWWHPDECVTPWVTTGEVAQVRSDRVRVIYETREKVSPAGLANSSAEIHPEGTVFLCRTASAGYSGIMGVAMATSQDFATWTCSDVLRPEFLLLCLRAMRQDLLGRLAVGSTHKTIYMPDIQALKIPLPDVDEQDVIIEKTNRLLNRSFEAEESLVAQVDLLAEKRQALITAAVTGELEIPGVAA